MVAVVIMSNTSHCVRYQEILHSIHLTRKARLGLRTCDGYAELLKYLRSDIQEVASRLQKGGLGYLDDNVDIEDKVNSHSLKMRLFPVFSENLCLNSTKRAQHVVRVFVQAIRQWAWDIVVD